jgi:hypothetical protein
VSSAGREREGLVFLLWGSYAQAKGKVIDSRRHCVLRAPHPSPLSAHRGFLGCGHFSAANRWLQRAQAPIDWSLPPARLQPAGLKPLGASQPCNSGTWPCCCAWNMHGTLAPLAVCTDPSAKIGPMSEP